MSWSYCADYVRQNDPDRFLITLFLPKKHREDFFALLAFNCEIAKTADAVSQEMLGHIRLQWWREALEQVYASNGHASNVRNHQVVKALVALANRVPKLLLDEMIDARAADLSEQPFGTVEDLESYAAKTSGNLLRAQASLIDKSLTLHEERALNHLGVAWALIGLARSMTQLKAQNRALVPPALTCQKLCDLAKTHEERGKVSGPLTAYGTASEAYLKVFKRTAFNPAHALVQRQPPSLAIKLWWQGLASYKVSEKRKENA